MNNYFLSKQNDVDALNLLKALSVAYTSAKRKENIISLIYLFLGIVYPVFYILSNDAETKLLLFQVSFFLTVVVQVFSPMFKGNTLKGALIQEEFDTSIFGLPWKSTLKKVDAFEISRLSLEFKGKELTNWYSSLINNKVSKEMQIALCQRSNTAYDKELRQKYRNLIFVFLVVYTICLALTIVLKNIGGTTVFFICFSTISFYVHFISIWRAQQNIIERLIALTSKLDGYIFGKTEPSISELRDIQDEIFICRQESAKVPNIFFRLWKNKIDTSFDNLIIQINKKYNQ